MRAFVDKELCGGCGRCAVALPGLFCADVDGKSMVRRDQVPPELSEPAINAAEQCPRVAITFET